MDHVPKSGRGGYYPNGGARSQLVLRAMSELTAAAHVVRRVCAAAGDLLVRLLERHL